MYRYTTPGLLHQLDPFLTWKIREAGKVIYLTFDDGPDPVITPWVMALLKKYDARATFFCVGDNVRKYPEVYNQLLAEGHSTGNHTFNHLDGWKTDNKTYYSNIEKCRNLVDSALFRPPYGKLGPAQALHLKNKSYRIIMWSLLSRDFEAGLDCVQSLASMKKNTGNGSIVLFHDSKKAEKNLRVLLPDFLEHFHHLGFKFEAL